MSASSLNASGQRTRLTRYGRVVFAVAGIAMVIAACVVVFGDGDERAKVLELAQRAPFNAVIAVTLLPLANLAISAAVFSVLLKRYGQVRFAELVTLMGSAWLLNYLPMRPGMLGRIAYHKKVNGIDVRHSVGTLIESMASSFVAAGLGLVVCRIADKAAWTDVMFMIWMAAISVGVCLTGKACMSRFVNGGAIGLAIGLRVADLFIWTLRYFTAFSITGNPIGMANACIVACASQAAMAFALWGNGLGVREWSVGLTGSGLLRGSGTVVGLTADLVNRIAELVTAIPLGIVCTIVATRHVREAGMKESLSTETANHAADDQRTNLPSR